MKPYLIKALILGLTFVGTVPAISHATDGNAYVRVGGGYSILTDLKMRGVAGSVRAEFKDGYAINAAVGYRFLDILRLELEGGYMDNKLKSYTVGGVNVLRSGDLQQISVMGNAILEVPFTESFYGYLGGGIGTIYSDLTADLGVGSSSSSDWAFAMQGMVGLGFNFTESISLSGGYRILGSSNPSYTLNNVKARYQAPISNIFEAALTFRF